MADQNDVTIPADLLNAYIGLVHQTGNYVRARTAFEQNPNVSTEGTLQGIRDQQAALLKNIKARQRQIRRRKVA